MLVVRHPEKSFVIDIYNDFFGLTERPFSLVPNPDFLYWGKVHARAFAMMEYGVMTRAPITLITGEVGAGKTTLLHHLLRSVDDAVVVGMVSNTQGDRGEILRWAMLGIEDPLIGVDVARRRTGLRQRGVADHGHGRPGSDGLGERRIEEGHVQGKLPNFSP